MKRCCSHTHTHTQVHWTQQCGLILFHGALNKCSIKPASASFCLFPISHAFFQRIWLAKQLGEGGSEGGGARLPQQRCHFTGDRLGVMEDLDCEEIINNLYQ